MNTISEKDAAGLIKSKLSKYFGVTPKEASKDQIYKAVVMCVRDMLLEKRSAFNKKYRDKRECLLRKNDLFYHHKR